MSLPETTLGNPLLEVDYEDFLRAYTIPTAKYKGEVERLARALARMDQAPHVSQMRRHRPEDTPRLSTLGDVVVPTPVVEEYLSVIGELVQSMSESLDSNLRSMSNAGYPGLPHLPSGSIVNQLTLVRAWRHTLFWLNVVDKMVQGAQQDRWIKWQGGWYSRRMALVPVSGVYTLLTLDACLMFKDMMYSRFLIHLYCHLDPHKRHLSTKLDQYVAWGAEVLVDRGNTGYDILKGIEALTQTGLILREEKILDGTAQHRAMLDKYTQKEIAIGGTGHHVQRLAQYIASFETSEDLAEAFGFLKLWGHPYVDPRAGCISAKKLAQQVIPLSPLSCLQLEWSFCHLYTRGYLRKTGRWPKLSFIPRELEGKTKLQTLYERNQPALAFGFTQYPASDWQWAQFAPHLSFDEGENILDLVVDRAISYKRSEFDASWPQKLDYRPPQPSTSSRVLEELVTRPDFDLSRVTQRVAARDIPWDWRIVTVSPKEREMKRDPRMFSMMVMEMRLFFVLTEHNIAEGVFKYIPEQTMTMSRQELLEVFLQSTRPLPGTWVRAVLGVDFSRWNLYWRKESVHPIGRRLNEIYGKPGVFDVVHDFFESCMCLLRSGGYPPDGLTSVNRSDPPEGRTLWYNHKGGFEGIAQKLWTAATVALIHMALWPLGLSYRIIGQGDNQVCILDCYVPPGTPEGETKEYIRRLVDRASQSIAQKGIEVGQVVKPEECIYSTCFLTYGKEMILRGAYLPTSLKYISRLFPSTTGDAPSLHEMISSISSGAVGAPDRNGWSYPTWVMAKVVEGLTIKRELKWSLFHGDKIRNTTRRLGLTGGGDITNIETKVIRALLSIPSNLGGLPITTIPELLYRGHSDPLSSSLLHLSLLSGIPEVDQYKRVLLKGWPLSTSPDVEGLILDPYSIPLANPGIPSSAVAAETGRVLPDITVNKEFSELFERAGEGDRLALFAWLESMNPFYPKLAHDIYKASTVGLRDAFIRRFSNTRTIISIGRRAGKNLATTSLTADLRGIEQVLTNITYIWKVATDEPSFTRPECYRVAVLLRRAWKRGEYLEGVSNGHPLTVGCLEWFPGPNPLSAGGCRIQVMGLTENTSRCTRTRGPINPYLGSSTGDKAVARWTRPTDTSPPLMDVLRVLAIRSLVAIPGSHLWSALTTIAQERSHLPVASLEQLLRIKIGGTLAHRYLTRDDPRGSYWNSCFNWPTHLTISTNLAGVLGERDYPFDFKEAMLSLSALTCWGFSLTRTDPPWGIQLVVNVGLMEEVGDRIVESHPYQPRPLPLTSNYYLAVQKVTLSTNALTSARLTQESLVLPFIRRVSQVEQALASLVLSHIRRGNPTTTRFGHTIGVPSMQRIIDIPELYSITTDEMLGGVTTAIWLKLGYSATAVCTRRKRRPDRLIQRMWDLEVRRSIPALAGTLRGVDHQSPSYGLGVGLGYDAELDSLARWMHEIHRRGIQEVPNGPFPIYTRGTASVSSLLAAGLGLVAWKECASADRTRFQNGKLLQRMVRVALQSPDEPSRVRTLCTITDVCGLNSLFFIDDQSPEEVLRQLRARGDEGVGERGGGQIARIYLPPLGPVEVEGGSRSLSIPLAPLDPVVLVESWLSRIPNIPASAEKWAPLRSGHTGPQRVLLVGVGIGDIGGALPLDWDVIGVELASTLQRLGHDSTTYQPPGLAGRFNLHPVSWSRGGDITDHRVRDELKEEAREGRYTLILIDVEGITNEARLAIRSQFADTGIPTYCKVLVGEGEAVELVASFCAYQLPADRIWTTLTYPGREYIVGASASPLGVFASVPSPNRVLPAIPMPVEEDYHITGYGAYNPGADLLRLTGHVPTLPRFGLILIQCRSLHSFIPPGFSLPPLIPLRDKISQFARTLLISACPRSRIKSLIRLFQHQYITNAFFSRMPQ